MGFKNQALVDAQGMSGGIWLMWNDDSIQIKVLKKHKQFLHCEIMGVSRFPWYFTAVYASPRAQERQEFWAEMEQLAVQVRGPWLLTGDFNDIKNRNEQRGGGEINENKCKKFCENIEKCRLIDLGTEGPRYTWRGPRVKLASRLYKKLDRALANVEWKMKFGEAKVKVGLRSQSDHHPLLIHLNTSNKDRGERPFRFEAAWLTHATFKEFVASKWTNTDEVWKTLNKMEEELKHWNVHTFGHINQRKKELTRRIDGAQRALQEAYNPHLEELEAALQEELREVLMQEEILWYQKARTKWLNDGDRNTSYYHMKTKIKRSRCKVTSLRNENNEWIDGRIEVGQLVNDYFQRLFHEENEDRRWTHTYHNWPEIEADSWRMLDVPLTNEEIKIAMFSIGGLKAPGEDGFQAIFFQKCWETVGESVCRSLRQVWEQPNQLSEINKTLITPIPKIENPEKV